MTVFDTLIAFVAGAAWAWLLSENRRASAETRSEKDVRERYELGIKLHGYLLKLARDHITTEKFAGKGTARAWYEFTVAGTPYRAVLAPAAQEEETNDA